MLTPSLALQFHHVPCQTLKNSYTYLNSLFPRHEPTSDLTIRLFQVLGTVYLLRTYVIITMLESMCVCVCVCVCLYVCVCA